MSNETVTIDAERLNRAIEHMQEQPKSVDLRVAFLSGYFPELRPLWTAVLPELGELYDHPEVKAAEAA